MLPAKGSKASSISDRPTVSGGTGYATRTGIAAIAAHNEGGMGKFSLSG